MPFPFSRQQKTSLLWISREPEGLAPPPLPFMPCFLDTAERKDGLIQVLPCNSVFGQGMWNKLRMRDPTVGYHHKNILWRFNFYLLQSYFKKLQVVFLVFFFSYSKKAKINKSTLWMSYP